MAGPLLIVIILGVAAWCAVTPGLGGDGGRLAVGLVLPWLGLVALVLGLALRLVRLLRAPLAGNGCLADGQRNSLDWVRPAGLEAPASPAQARLRRWRNLLLFRPLRKGSRLLVNPHTNQPLPYPSGWLRLGLILFHFSLLLVLLRHLGLWLNPAPGQPATQLATMLDWLNGLDGFFLLDGRPLYLSELILPVSLLFLLLRRRLDPLLRRISRPADYFGPLLLLAICCSGLGLRHVSPADPAALSSFWQGLVRFSLAVPPAPSADLPQLFYLHLFFGSLLLLFIPFSKLGHLGTAWLAPAWSRPLLPACALGGKRTGSRGGTVWTGRPEQSYAEYAAAFGPGMREAGIPVDAPKAIEPALTDGRAE